MDAVWVALEAALSEGRSLASASRAVTIAGKPGWCGVLGEGGWPREAKDFSQGFLVLHNLLDRQPHMGDGVGFPDTSYRSLLRNIRESGIEAFEILYAVPDDVVVPRWRLPSLFPVAPELLRRDLGVGWKGIVAGELQAGGVEREWWRGLPRLEGASRHVEQTTLPESPLPLVTSIFEARRCPQLGRYPRLKMTMEGSFRYAFTLGAAGIGMSDRRERHRSARLGCLQQINAHLAGGAAPSA